MRKPRYSWARISPLIDRGSQISELFKMISMEPTRTLSNFLLRLPLYVAPDLTSPANMFSTIGSKSFADDVVLYRRRSLNSSCISFFAGLSSSCSVSAASSNVTNSVSMGNVPRKGMFSLLAIDSPPPVENTLLISPQHGHAYPLMFSITPKSGRETVRANETHFNASKSATACGVVTTTPDKRECAGDRCSISEMCSSEVPVQCGIYYRRYRWEQARCTSNIDHEMRLD